MNPIEASSRWHRWTVRGTGGAISKLLAWLDANLPLGWTRLNENDLRQVQALAGQDSALYTLDTTPRVSLGLKRIGENELRGGRVWFMDFPNLIGVDSAMDGWGQVMRFLDDGILVAARTVGADVRIPTPAEVFLSELPSDVRDRLQEFSASACKSRVLSRQQTDLWHEFVIAAYRAKVVIDAPQFTDWLTTEGWSKEWAAELNGRFLDQCMLLSRYADEVSAA